MNYDVIIVGGGQSGLAVGYYLRRTNYSFVILDGNENPGGSWQYTWNSLQLFSPAQWSSLPGVLMPGGGNYYPTRDEALNYLKNYEIKYQLPVKRPVQVLSIRKTNTYFAVETSVGVYQAKAVVAATGSYRNPFIPAFEGAEKFKGKILHSASYTSPKEFAGKKVAVVGEGNSGAQILAEVSAVAQTIWVTQKEPRFLPDQVDGRYLFDAATQMYAARQQGKSYQPPSLGDVVMVPSVKEARDRGVLSRSTRPFQKLSATGLVWADGHEENVDAIIFCTGFKPSLSYLAPLQIVNEDGKVTTEETKSTKVAGLWLVGFGNWTGFASATLIGVGRSAKLTVDQIQHYLHYLPISS